MPLIRVSRFIPDSTALHVFRSLSFHKHCIFNKSINCFFFLSHTRPFSSLVSHFYNVVDAEHSSIYGGFVHILQNIRKNIITNIEFVATTDSISHTRHIQIHLYKIIIFFCSQLHGNAAVIHRIHFLLVSLYLSTKMLLPTHFSPMLARRFPFICTTKWSCK